MRIACQNEMMVQAIEWIPKKKIENPANSPPVNCYCIRVSSPNTTNVRQYSMAFERGSGLDKVLLIIISHIKIY
jgi:hypothetical protein